MPEIGKLIALLTITGCLVVLADAHILKRKARTTGKEQGSSKERLSDAAAFSPFIALAYTDHFWTSLLWTLPVILAVTATQRVFYRKGWLDTPSELVVLAPGSYLLVIIAYFMFFHEGLVESSPVEPETAGTGAPSSWSIYWLSALYVTCFLLAIVPKKADSTFLSLVFLIPAITILPFFTGHYFWFMLLGFLLLLVSVHRGIKHMEAGSVGALSAIGGYFYLLAAFASIVVYAILY